MTDLAWAAGLIDGEGCISIKKTKVNNTRKAKSPYYSLILGVKMVHKPAIDKLYSIFLVGSIIRREGKGNIRPTWTWCVGGTPAVAKILKAILPFSIVKLSEIHLALLFSSIINKAGYKKLVPVAVLEERERLYKSMKLAKRYAW